MLWVLIIKTYVVGTHKYPQHVFMEDKAILTYVFMENIHAGRGSSIGSVSTWHASSPEFAPHVQHILSWRLGHEKISMAILSLQLIQEEQLSVTGERMCTKYW